MNDWLKPEVILSLFGVLLIPGIGSFIGVKFGLQAVDAKVSALHKRFDEMEQRQQKNEVELGRHDERIANLKESQRFWIKETQNVFAKGDIG
jgi:hypothetical protein